MSKAHCYEEGLWFNIMLRLKLLIDHFHFKQCISIYISTNDRFIIILSEQQKQYRTKNFYVNINLFEFYS